MSRGKRLVALATADLELSEIPHDSLHDEDYGLNNVLILDNVEFDYIESCESYAAAPSSYNTQNTDSELFYLEAPTIDNHSTPFVDIIPGNFITLSTNNTIETSPSTLTSYNFNETNSNFTNQILEVEHTSNLIATPLQIISNPSISDESGIDTNRLVPYSDSNSSSESITELKKSKSRKKRFQVDKREWFAEKNKKRRETGKMFYGREKTDEGVWNYNKKKVARTIKSRCTCKISRYSTLKCETIDDDSRKSIFERFWTLTWGQKKTLVNEWVTKIPSIRPRNRQTTESTRRAYTFVYHLKVHEEAIKVCRKMFLNTLDIGRWTVQQWKLASLEQQPSVIRSQNVSGQCSEMKKSLIQFLESLPVMESHYCRATSQKLYLLPEWKSKESLYRFYVNDWCKERGIKPVSICLFSNVFEGKNFALFRPKKDQCEKCAGYKVGTITEDIYRSHLEKKEQAREEKENDKKGDHYVLAVDLQAVLMAPKSNVSTLYYKTKLQVHNLCFFNLKNKDGFCYLWNEVEGGVNAEEFASIWVDFLENAVISEFNVEDNKTIIIYSDGCTYQNRNSTLSNALLNIVMKHKNIIIEQKFLEPGHTQMEADSMHSTIERQLKDRDINVPAEYVSIVKNARKCPVPYNVKYLNYDYFKKIDKILFYKSIRPGRSKGDYKVTDIRALRYEPNGTILYKTSFKDVWQILPQRRALQWIPCNITDLPQLHQARRKITARKFNDLQEIKLTLPSDYHKYYDDLPHE